MKNILITGGAGFIASNFIKLLLEQHHHQPTLVNLDKLTYASNINNLKDINHYPNYKFIKGDIANPELVKSILSKYNIQTIINFAAETSVEKSIYQPQEFIKTNIQGTHTLLMQAYHHWTKTKQQYQNNKFIHISTDEVYGTLPQTGKFNEQSPYAPNNPYSATKAAADMIVRSYINTYTFPAIITHSSNNYGPRQHKEKLIPKVITSALNNTPITIHGTGQHIRDWIHVTDYCNAIYTILQKANTPAKYNIGANDEISTIQIANTICNILDQKLPRKDNKSYKTLIKHIPDRPGNDTRYAIDSSKIQNELKWQPKQTFNTSIHKTIDWYIQQHNNQYT